MRLTGPLESAALLTVLPGARAAGGVDPGRAAVGAAGRAWSSAGSRAGVAVARRRGGSRRWPAPCSRSPSLAVLTRGLHLDGLADTADGLGPLRARERALQVMHQSDIGPFGVVTLVLTLLLQVGLPGRAAARRTAAGSRSGRRSSVARLAMARTGLPGVPIAEGSSLGALVAGTVSAAWFAGWRCSCSRRSLAGGRRSGHAGRRRRAARRSAPWPACSRPRSCTAGPAPGWAA